MCGITGFLDLSHSHSSEELQALVTRMSDTIRHRGPDDSGAWADPESGVVLGFRRLAILDLSPAGHQPMSPPMVATLLSKKAKFIISTNCALNLPAWVMPSGDIPN